MDVCDLKENDPPTIWHEVIQNARYQKSSYNYTDKLTIYKLTTE